MEQNEGDIITPREYDYWKLTYRELILLPDWAELNAEGRARKMHERIEEKLHQAGSPLQLKALFECTPKERLNTVRKMIEHFENDIGGW